LSFTLRFGSKTFAASIRGKEFAEGWLGYLLDCRQRALELTHDAVLDRRVDRKPSR